MRDDTIRVSWQEFKDLIQKELPTSSRFRTQDDAGRARLLFRGHSDSRWPLQSTLERAGYSEMAVARYAQASESARRYMGNVAPSEIRFDPEVDCSYGALSHGRFPNYEYAAFLRHHGFPSPLLDWTESPFVAAFFAFRHRAPGVDSVAIYGYRSFSNYVKGFSSGEAGIRVMGPFASIHERHLAQQCQYTFCIKSDRDSVVFCPHEEALNWDAAGEQDVVTKWELDAGEREQVLAELLQMNITPFSLFRTIDGAAETAALRVL